MPDMEPAGNSNSADNDSAFKRLLAEAPADLLHDIRLEAISEVENYQAGHGALERLFYNIELIVWIEAHGRFAAPLRRWVNRRKLKRRAGS